MTVAKVELKDMPIFKDGIGSAQAFQSVLVRARVDGAIQQIAFTEGQDVKPRRLARSDRFPALPGGPGPGSGAQGRPYRHAGQCQTGPGPATRTWPGATSRSRQSVDTQTASVTQSQAQTQGDDASFAAAKLNLDFTRITAPDCRPGWTADGRPGKPGSGRRQRRHRDHQPDPPYFGGLHPAPGQSSRGAGTPFTPIRPPLTVLAFASDDKRKLSDGQLLTIDNSIDASTGTIKLKAKFDNADDRLWPGEFINAHLQLAVAKNAVVVPSAARAAGRERALRLRVEAGQHGEPATGRGRPGRWQPDHCDQRAERR